MRTGNGLAKRETIATDLSSDIVVSMSRPMSGLTCQGTRAKGTKREHPNQDRDRKIGISISMRGQTAGPALCGGCVAVGRHSVVLADNTQRTTHHFPSTYTHEEREDGRSFVSAFCNFVLKNLEPNLPLFPTFPLFPTKVHVLS